MKLKFFAREDLLVRELGVHRYYGREFDAAARTWPATKDGVAFEAGTPDADKCAKACRKGSLFAADEATARALDVAFVATEFKDGAHVATAPKTKPAAPAPTKEAS